MARSRSTLHLQMGQETIYLLLTISLFVAFMMASRSSAERRQDEPPIITLSEAQGYYFEPGSSAVSADFARRLKDTIGPRVQQIGDQYDASVIEVIGHTDELPLRQRGSGNLDQTLVRAFTGQRSDPPVAADNTGLGMARAVAVAQALRIGGLETQFTLVPMSAGPFLKPDDSVTDGNDVRDAQERRRIEIRVRRRQPPKVRA